MSDDVKATWLEAVARVVRAGRVWRAREARFEGDAELVEALEALDDANLDAAIQYARYMMEI